MSDMIVKWLSTLTFDFQIRYSLIKKAEFSLKVGELHGNTPSNQHVAKSALE